MNFKQFLSEMPITGFHKFGDWRPDAKRRYGFTPQDAGIIANNKGEAKIIRQWSNSKQNFELYFVRNSKAYQNYGRTITPEQSAFHFGVHIPAKPNAITMVYTNNFASEKMPFNAWQLAHRMGHAFAREEQSGKGSWTGFVRELNRDFQQILRYVYKSEASSNQYNTFTGPSEQLMNALAYAVGTMKSARDRNLRRFFEFPYELLSQYLLTGHIKFNPLPKFLLIKDTKAWGRPNPQGARASGDLDDWNEFLQNNIQIYEGYLDEVFRSYTGKIVSL